MNLTRLRRGLTPDETRLFFSANGTFLCQPRVQRREETNVAQPWVRFPPKPKSPNGAAVIRTTPFSIPNIPFINLNSMSLAQLTEFVLERHPLVVVLLVGNVTFDLLDV